MSAVDNPGPVDHFQECTLVDAGLIGHFQQLYLDDADPWQVGARWYEQRKRAMVLASLPQARYANAYEPGCGNGELTVALAARCARLLAADAAPAAVALARARVREAGLDANVTIRLHSLPQDFPLHATPFDLIVISELAYYFTADQLDALAARCAQALAPGGDLLLCHYRPPFADRIQTTHAAHATFARQPRLQRMLRHEESDFLLDVLRADSFSTTDHNLESPCSA
jgi:SAM-dependent methyltransferase